MKQKPAGVGEEWNPRPLPTPRPRSLEIGLSALQSGVFKDRYEGSYCSTVYFFIAFKMDTCVNYFVVLHFYLI